MQHVLQGAARLQPISKGEHDMEASKPTYEKRLGHIRLTIWENLTEGRSDAKGDPEPWYNINILRHFKQQDGEWRAVPAFNGLADLALVAECVQLARAWILAREHQA
jgi:hypothetical protein